MNWFVNSGSSFGEGEDVLIKQLLLSHDPDGRWLDSEQLISAVESVMTSASTTPTVQQQQLDVDGIEWNDDEDGIEIVGSEETLGHILWKIMSQLCYSRCKVFVGGEMSQHSRTMALFDVVGTYKWDAKVVLVLAAFAASYGRFWLVKQQLHHQNSPVAILRHLPRELVAVGPRFKALDLLFKTMVDVAKLMIKFEGLPFRHVKLDVEPIGTTKNCIYVAAYWVVRCSFSCFSMVSDFTAMKQPEKAWELSSMAHKVTNIHSHLMKQLTVCYQHIDEKRHIEAFQALIRLFEMVHIDNLKILRALIYGKDDQLPLMDGATRKRVSLDVLRRKNVLLLISDLELSHEELSMLEQMYHEARQHPTRLESQYEVVWMPVVDRSTPWNEEKQKNFERIQSMMPWYSVYHPSLLDRAVIRYIKEYWHFNKKPLLVVLDPQGKVVNPNALHMMWIWGSMAFPFTSAREEALWKDETWRLELLADAIDPVILSWIAQGKFIILYGGEDMEWIRKFTVTAKAVAQAAGISLEMLYVGKSSPREKVRKNNVMIQSENLSHVLPDLTLIWFFWVRLESMWHSKVQHNRTVENDVIMQEIVTMLSFDGSEQGWAVVSRASAEMAKGKGETILKSFMEFEEWRPLAEERGFIPALNEYLLGLHTPLHCNRLILPGSTGSIPDRVVCAECGRAMEKFIMYRCCTD
ncbi:Protein SIEVE ELEMENT OCCLUSION B [Linum perenne]